MNYTCKICNTLINDSDWLDEYFYCENCNYILYPLWDVENKKYIDYYEMYTLQGANFIGNGNFSYCMKILKMKVFI